MPRLWNTKLDSGSYGERPVPASVQLRQIILLHEGKARDAHHPPSSLLHLSSATNLSLNHYSFCHRCCHCISSFIQICRRCYVSSFVHICDCRLSPLRSTQDRLSLFLFESAIAAFLSTSVLLLLQICSSVTFSSPFVFLFSFEK